MPHFSKHAFIVCELTTQAHKTQFTDSLQNYISIAVFVKYLTFST